MHKSPSAMQFVGVGLASVLVLGACSARVTHETGTTEEQAPVTEEVASPTEGAVSAAIGSPTDDTGNLAEGEADNVTDSRVGAHKAAGVSVTPTAYGLLAYDESIPATDTESWWALYDDLESLSHSADLGFVGQVIGYVERVKVVSHSEEVPAVHRGANVYDAIVFAIDEILVGDKFGSDTVSVAVRRLILNPDGTPRYRVNESPIEILEPGITARGSLDKPTYIVYLTEDEEVYSPFYNSGYYFFNTPGGVAPMLDGERIGNAVDRPLARPVVVEDGVYRQVDHGLTLDDARAVGRVAESEISPPSDSDPPDPLGDLTPADIGPLGVADE